MRPRGTRAWRIAYIRRRHPRVEDSLALGAVRLEAGHNGVGDGPDIDEDTDVLVGDSTQVVDDMGSRRGQAASRPSVLVPRERCCGDGCVK